MTEKQRLNTLRRALRHLRETKQGYSSFDPEEDVGGHWKVAMSNLEALEADLAPKARVPSLGPVVWGGIPLLLQDCTHISSGVTWPDGNEYPALDDGWTIGRNVIAPEDLVITRQSDAQGGDAFYATGKSRIRYWFGHVDSAPATGKKFRKGEVLARISADHPRPHVHVGLDVVPLTGETLKSHRDYTHGAPKIGVQLHAMLNR